MSPLLPVVSPSLGTGASATPQHVLEPVSYARIPGWQEDDHTAALEAFRRSQAVRGSGGSGGGKSVSLDLPQWIQCALGTVTKGQASSRKFFEGHFAPHMVRDSLHPEGLFTGYFEPEVEGSRTRNAEFAVPIYRKPEELVIFDSRQQRESGLPCGRIMEGRPQRFLTRLEIEQGALAGRGLEVVWLRDWSDAYFVHVQGSARVRCPDGSNFRLAFGARSGLPYTSIGRLLVFSGELRPETVSMQSILAWMRRNPRAARQLMWKNESFIFFNETPFVGTGPLGAQGVELMPGRSLAVDPSVWPFGTPIWLDTRLPAIGEHHSEEFRHLLVAQDAGSAILGAARGDIYFGHGEVAAMQAGAMKSSGRMFVLLPREAPA